MLLDFRLDFQEHWKSLIISTIYECVFSIHLDYGDIIYDQAFNNSFHKKMNPYYITQLQLSQAPPEEPRGKKFIKNQVQSHFNKDAGIENCVSFSRYIKTNARNTFLIKSHNQIVNIELEIDIIPHPPLHPHPSYQCEAPVFKIYFFHQP